MLIVGASSGSRWSSGELVVQDRAERIAHGILELDALERVDVGRAHVVLRRSRDGVGQRDDRRLLRRRHWWMIAVGVVHVVLLWQGDILSVYGLLGLLLVPLVINRSGRTARIWIIVLLSLSLAVSIAVGRPL